MLPSEILSNCNPVTPVAGIPYKPPPSPLKLPVNEPVVYDDVNELNVVSSNLPVPIGLPFNDIEPVITMLPVNSCISSMELPNMDEPDSYRIDAVVIDA